MTSSFHIIEAAAIIRKYDVDLAAAFIASPFRRSLMVEAFRLSLNKQGFDGDMVASRVEARLMMHRELVSS